MTTKLTNQQIDLPKLDVHPNNVRGEDDYDKDGIELLAQHIDEFGLLQNLVVQPLDGGRYGVLAGGRRLRALQHLDSSGRLDMRKIPCRVLPKDMPCQTAISLAENAMQQRMNPIDEFDAFCAMIEQGQTEEQIAGIFGITIRQVRERLRYGRVHPDIRAAARNGDITLDVLKTFAAHPCQSTQHRVFNELSAAQVLQTWSVRRHLEEVDVTLQDQIGKYVIDQYRAKGGEIIPALFEEETVLRDRSLVHEIALDQLHTMAAGIAAEKGFGWADARLVFDYDEFRRHQRIYPSRTEPTEEDAARLSELREKIEAIEGEMDDAHPNETTNLEARYEALETEIEEIEERSERYDPDQAKKAGVIVCLGHNGPETHQGLVMPEDAANDDERSESEGTTSVGKREFKLSQRLTDDLGTERADAVARALLEQPRLAQDTLLFTIARKVLSYGYGMEGIDLSCHPASRGHSNEDARDHETLEAIENHHRSLDLSWLDPDLSEGAQFMAFSALDREMKEKINAWCLGAIISPDLISTPGGDADNSLVQTVARIALPDIRQRWTPTAANYWSRVTKRHMIELLQRFDMNDAADEMRSAKKEKLADYMEQLFAAPFATLTPDQLSAIHAWAPPGMSTGDGLPLEPIEEDAAAA